MSGTRNFISSPEQPDLSRLLSGGDLCALCASQGTCCCRTDMDAVHLSFPLSLPEWRRMAPYAHLAGPLEPDGGKQEMPEEQLASVPPAGPASGSPVAARTSACLSVGQTSENPEEALLPPLGEHCTPPAGGDALCSSEANTEEFLQAMRSLFPREKDRLAALFPAQERHLRMRVRNDGSCVFQGRSGCRLPRAVRPWYCLLFPAWMQGNMVTLFMAQGCLFSQRAKSPMHGLKLLHTTREEVHGLFTALRKDWGLPV